MKKTLKLKVGKEYETIDLSLIRKITYEDLSRDFVDYYPGRIVLAKADNHLYELGEFIGDEVEEISFIDTVDTDGNRVYMRGLTYVLIIAVSKIFPDCSLVVEHSISEGLYCTIRQGDSLLVLDSHTRDKLKKEMKKIIDDDHIIEKSIFPLEKAIKLFEDQGRMDKVDLLKYRKRDSVSLYKLDGFYDYFYGHMVPSTSYVKAFDLELFDHGLVLIGCMRDDKDKIRNFLPHYKLSQAYNEAEKWARMQGMSNVSKLNQIIERGDIGDVCRMSEALQQHKIMKIAEEIMQKNKRVILIAAPSSSGKTSFAYKLNTSLRVLGQRPISISLDDYYVDRDKTPLDDEGLPDFESLYSIDLDLFNHDLKKLLLGESIEKISFDFIEGKRVHTGKMLILNANSPIIIEGIHGLNPELTKAIDASYKFKIYLNVITQINLDDHNRVATTDLRLLRRMARDKQFRGKDIRDTILEWPRVRAGEKRNIFPYQEEADMMFSSSFIFDISAIKPIVMKNLEEITDDDEAYIEAARLKSFLQYFVSLKETDHIVNTSILREFIGGSMIV